MANYYRLPRCKSETNLMNLTLSRTQRSKSLNDVQYSAALEEQMRENLHRLKNDLQQEQQNVAAIKRDNVLKIMAAREEEISHARSAHENLALKMLQEKDEAVRIVEENARIMLYQEIDKVKRGKDEELRRSKREWEYEKEILLNSLNDQMRSDIRSDCQDEFERVHKKNEMEYFNLASENRALNEELKIVRKADREKAEEIRRILQEQGRVVAELKRDASKDSRRQLAEMKQMQKIISQLEKRLDMESGSCLRLQMEKESLDEALSRLKLADSWDKRISRSNIKGIGDAEYESEITAALPLRLSTRPHNDPERVLHRRVIELSSLVRRLDEHNQEIVARNLELLDEIENAKNDREPLQQKAKKLGTKNMELVQTNRRQEERITLQQEELLSTKEKLKLYEDMIGKRDKELSKLRNKLKVKIDVETQKEHIETLENAVQEQLQIIYELRQQSVEKDRRIDVLRERKQRKHAKKDRKKRGRKSASPDSLNNECLEEDSLSISSETETSAASNAEELNSSFNGNVIAAEDRDDFTRLLKEKLDLERSYTLLQQQVASFQDPERSQLQIDVVQSDLLVAQAKIQDLENLLEDAITNSSNNNDNDNHKPQINPFEEEREKLRMANKTIHEKLITAESEILSKTLEITRLTQDLNDVEEQRDLLEFRIMELEHISKPKSPDIGSMQLTDDDKIHLTQETEEVDCDVISVRIALKELEINKQSLLSHKEKNALVQAINLVEKGDKKIANLETSEKRLNRRVNEVQGKYNNLKIRYAEMIQKENEQVMLAAVKSSSEDNNPEFVADNDIFSICDPHPVKTEKKLIRMQEDQENKLKEANQKITELEASNASLQQAIEKHDVQKDSELSDDEIEILRRKVEELKDASKRINELELKNSNLEDRVKEFESENEAMKIIEEQVDSEEIPRSIAMEVMSLKEENRSLSEELSALRNHCVQERNSVVEMPQSLLTHKDTQTTSEDDIPWNKYMSPRSDRSLSRNESVFTPRSQCDEGTQTPRIYEGSNQTERLTIEEPLQSAPVVERLNFNIEPSSPPTFDEKTNHDTWSTESIKNSLEASSVESLFRFADQLVKEATDEAKDTLKEELSLSFHSNSLQSLDFTSPKEIGTAEEPGKMIDMYIEKGYKAWSLQNQEICGSHNPNNIYNLSESTPSDAHGEMLPLEFDPLQIETSSVDENSYVYRNMQATEEHGRCVTCTNTTANTSICAAVHSSADLEALQSVVPGESNRQQPLRSSNVSVGSGNRLEASSSLASNDIDELLCYGAALRDYHCGGYITSSYEEESTLIDAGSRNNDQRTPMVNCDTGFGNSKGCDTSHLSMLPGSDTTLASYRPHTQKSKHTDNTSDKKMLETCGKISRPTVGNLDTDTTIDKEFDCLFDSSREDQLVLPTFKISPVQDLRNDDCQNKDSPAINYHDKDINRRHYYSKDPDKETYISYFNSTSSTSDGPVTPKRYDSCQRKLLQNANDSLKISNTRNRFRSRSVSPMRRFGLRRPRSYSAGSVYTSFSEQFPGDQSEIVSRKGTKSSTYSRQNKWKRNSSFDSAEYSSDIFRQRGDLISPRDDEVSYSATSISKHGWKTSNSLQNSKYGPNEPDRMKRDMNMLREECASLERQLKNKDAIMRTMKAELKEEVENIALLEKKEKLIQEKVESNACLTQELQRCQKELDGKNSEISRKDYEINRLKTEIKNLEISKKHTEKSYSEIQVQVNQVEITERKLADVQEQHDIVLLKNRELIDRIKHLEVAEKEFIELERNVIDLQEQLQVMETVEVDRDELYEKFHHLKRQRDDFLKKGRMVEEERNDFLRTNQTMEQHLEEYKKKFSNVKKSNGELNRRILVLEREKKEVETKILDVQNDRNIMQTALGKLEIERDDLIREVKEVTSEKILLEQKLAEMDDMLSDHDHLEEGFHSLRLKLAELTRQRDDAEMLIPSLKAKIALLKKSCREKDETVTRYVEEIKQLKYNVSASHTSDKSKVLYELSQPNSRSKHKSSSFFVETNREERHRSKPRRIEYELVDDSVQLSEEDQSISEDGSIILDRRHLVDTRAQSGRAVRVYEQRSRPVGRAKNYKAIFDYDPYKSSSSIHPERELRLKEGDYITVYGEMDVNGYLEAEVDGESGLVPSIYVEEFEDEGRNISRANESRSMVARSAHSQRQRKFVSLYDYDPFTMGKTGRPEQQLSLRKGDVITVIGDIDIDGYYTAELNGRSGLVPSNFIRELGGSQTTAASSYGGHKSFEQQQQQMSRSVEQRNSSTSRTGTIEVIRDDVVGPPFPPSNLKIIRVVNKDSALLTWKLPPMDKSGRSNGALITGYKIWVNGRPKQEVKSHTMTKAIVSGLNLRDKLDLDIQTVGENGFCSEKCNYNITGAYSLLNPVYEEFFAKAPGNYRTFVSLYDYDPFKSSPNPNPSLELGFTEGDLLKVFDTSRTDGFYQAELRGKSGLVPSNFLEEISVPDSLYTRGGDSYSLGGEASQGLRSGYSQSTSHQHQQQRHSSSSEYEKRSSLSTGNGARKRKMVAVYDYDPMRQSPSKDKSKELNLRKGQYVTVIGDMRPDGFYVGEIEGRQGLVPGDFLETYKDDDSDSRRVQFAPGEEMK